jgi:ABC-type antimicrobial peptide transport system permease subunit
MTTLAPETGQPIADENAPGPANVAHAAPALDRGTAFRLVQFALANVRRRPERSLLAVAGIALAIAAVVVVRTVAASYQTTGAGAVTAAIGDDSWWVVPEGGVHLDASRGVVVAEQPPPAVDAPAGWTVTPVLTGAVPGHDDVALVGRPGPPPGTAAATDTALDRLDLDPGATLAIAGHDLVLTAGGGSGAALTVPLDVAADAGLTAGWTTLAPPAGTTPTSDAVAELTGLEAVTDPSRVPAAGSGGLVYATDDSAGRAGLVSFDQKMAAYLGGQVTSSALGLIAQVGLVLGFVIAVSTFVAAVQERRREFGIMASVGLTDEVLYFFLVESLLLFVVAYLVGVGLGGGLVALALPHFFSAGSWLAAAGMVAMYLPALAVVAALVPVHRLLQQRPVALLAEEA